MDPNAVLAEMRDLAIVARGFGSEQDADRMAALVWELDGWLSDGGALPSEWQR